MRGSAKRGGLGLGETKNEWRAHLLDGRSQGTGLSPFLSHLGRHCYSSLDYYGQTLEDSRKIANPSLPHSLGTKGVPLPRPLC